MDFNQKLIEQRQEQIVNWRVENQLGFSLWTTMVVRGSFLGNLTLEAVQCKDGIYILQIAVNDSSFLIYKCEPDICLKTIRNGA